MIGFKSDVGCRRKLNEDNFGYIESEEYKLYIVADGMGGHNAGEVASELAIEKIKSYVRNNIKELGLDTLKKAIEYANDEIYNYSNQNETLRGMGTTITVGLILNDDVLIANVGDSSCFGIIQNRIHKLTKDHSLVQQLLDSGSISEVQARNHPSKNIITRALGTSEKVDVDIFKFKLGDYEKYLLCTDGLTNEVLEEDIEKLLCEEKDSNIICDRLVNLANQNGGKDNITVMLFGGER